MDTSAKEISVVLDSRECVSLTALLSVKTMLGRQKAAT